MTLFSQNLDDFTAQKQGLQETWHFVVVREQLDTEGELGVLGCTGLHKASSHELNPVWQAPLLEG